MWVKICGVTTPEGAEALASAGVDAVGINLVWASPRRVTPKRARELVQAVAGRAEAVLVVAGLPVAEVSRLLDFTGAARAQLHGDEGPEWLAAEPRCFHVARLGSPADVDHALGLPGDRLLVDARVEGVLGGTGRRVAAPLAQALAARRRVVLAGGLTPDNVAAAVAEVRPWGVDTASGVEAPGQPGLKLPARVAAFVSAARGV